MLSHRQASFIGVDEYLEGEKQATVKHEYADGDVYAMAGGTRRHNTLVFNLSASIGAQLQTPCRGFGPDMKIRVRQDQRFYYPDLSVSCQEETGDPYYTRC